jgi:hypothetical protein
MNTALLLLQQLFSSLGRNLMRREMTAVSPAPTSSQPVIRANSAINSGAPNAGRVSANAKKTSHFSAKPLRVVRVVETGQARSSVGRMVISGSMADVCAELERLAAREAALT